MNVESFPLFPIRHGDPLSPILYVLALEPFFCRIKANPIIRGIILPGATISAKYTTYADDVSTLVMSNAQMDQVGRELRRYETVSGAKINRDKSILTCGLVGESEFLCPDLSTGWTGNWFSPDWRLIDR